MRLAARARRFCAAIASALVLAVVCAPGVAQPAPDEPALAPGQAAYDRHDYATALALWRSALAASGQPNAPQNGPLLLHVGLAYDALGDATSALSYFQRALVAHRAAANKAGEATALLDIGNVELKLRRYADALAAFEQAQPIAQATVRTQEPADWRGIGSALEGLGRGDEALAAQRHALAAARDIGNQFEESDALNQIGYLEQVAGHFTEALATHEEALTLDRTMKYRFRQARDLNQIGLVRTRLGRYEEALVDLHEAAAIAVEIKNRPEEARADGLIGNALFDLGRYAPAEAAYREGLSIARDIKNRAEEANELNNLGELERAAGRYDEALDSLHQSLAIDAALDNRFQAAAATNGIGSVFVNLGNYPEALSWFDRAIVLFRSIHNAFGEAVGLANVGIGDIAMRRYAAALVPLHQALDIDRSTQDRRDEAVTLTNVGTAEMGLMRYADALADLRAALAIDRAIGNRSGQIGELNDIGLLEGLSGEYDEALATARQAIAIERELADRESLWRSLSVSAAANAKLDRRVEALAGYTASLEEIESLRADLRSDERSGFFAGKLFVYDDYIAYLRDLDARFPGQGYDRKALEIFERKSARATLEQIGASAADHFQGVPAAVIADEAAAENAVTSSQSQLAKASLAEPIDRGAIAAAEGNLRTASEHLAGVEADIRARYPAYAELRQPQPLAVACEKAPCPTLGHFQRSVLQPDEVMLAYDLLEGRSVLWVVERDRLTLLSLPAAAQIARAVTRLNAHVAGMSSPGMSESKLERVAATDIPAFAADSYALYSLLVPPAAQAALGRAKSLIVVPSNALYALAFETLVTKDPGSGSEPHYLIQDVPISYVASASLLEVVRTSYAQRSNGRSPLLAFANPAFGAASTATDQASRLSSVAALQVATARSALAGAVFVPLPGTKTEADAVRAALGASGASVISGEAATREHLLGLNTSGALKNYRYVLFATHAVLPSEIQGLAQPAIVLAHPERSGLLTMADVFGLSLDADFVTLSACNTGVGGSDAGGDGISGLSRAFLFAGTPALSVTLWEVDDLAAPRITPPFFAAMRAGSSPSQALRQAKLALLKSPQARFRHPYAWAPSVIFGDGDRL